MAKHNLRWPVCYHRSNCHKPSTSIRIFSLPPPSQTTVISTLTFLCLLFYQPEISSQVFCFQVVIISQSCDHISYLFSKHCQEPYSHGVLSKPPGKVLFENIDSETETGCQRSVSLVMDRTAFLHDKQEVMPPQLGDMDGMQGNFESSEFLLPLIFYLICYIVKPFVLV